MQIHFLNTFYYDFVKRVRAEIKKYGENVKAFYVFYVFYVLVFEAKNNKKKQP